MEQSPKTRGERTRLAIIDGAREVILNQGYTAASMRDIGKAAGITPAAIYNHFESKEELFTSLLQEAAPIQEMSAFLRQVSAGSAEDLLAKAFHGLVALLKDHEDYIRLALIDAQERNGATLVTFVPTMFPLLVGLGQQLQALDEGIGRLRPIQPTTIARALISLIIGFVLTERIARPQQTLNLPSTVWESGLLDILMFGLFMDK